MPETTSELCNYVDVHSLATLLTFNFGTPAASSNRTCSKVNEYCLPLSRSEGFEWRNVSTEQLPGAEELRSGNPEALDNPNVFIVSSQAFQVNAAKDRLVCNH